MSQFPSTSSSNASHRLSIIVPPSPPLNPVNKSSPYNSSNASHRTSSSSAESLKPGALKPTRRQRRRRANVWTRLSTRWKIVTVLIVLAVLGIVIGVPVGEHEKNERYKSANQRSVWKPSMGSPWNIQLDEALTAANVSGLAAMYDIDLFDNPKSTIDYLHNLNQRVICYFSAGTYESYRSDASSFPSNVLGNTLPDYPDEKWVDTRNQAVRDIMSQRLDMAVAKGCDGVDPDNIDGYSSDTGFPLTTDTAVDYLDWLSQEAHSRKIAIGLKNGVEVVDRVVGTLDWAIVEQCAQYNECSSYTPFISAGRPVFRIEYANDTGVDEDFILGACNADGSRGMSTLIKNSNLDAWFEVCPISYYSFGSIWA